MHNINKNNLYIDLQTKLSILSNYSYSLNNDLNQLINQISVRYSNDDFSSEEIKSLINKFEEFTLKFDSSELNLIISHLKNFVGKRSYGNLSLQEKIWIYQDYLTQHFSQNQLADKYLTYQKAIFLTIQEFNNSYKLNPFNLKLQNKEIK